MPDAAIIELTGTTYPGTVTVELLSVGMDWPTWPEPSTITQDDLLSAIAASQGDPFIRAPRVKLGHLDPRLNAEEDITPAEDGGAMFNPLFDGEPVYGRVENLRLDDAGVTLLGDLAAVPAWLLNQDPDTGVVTLSSAYPSRSCEWTRNFASPSGGVYDLVITACALIGERSPAIRDVRDLATVLHTGLEADELDDESAIAAVTATIPQEEPMATASDTTPRHGHGPVMGAATAPQRPGTPRAMASIDTGAIRRLLDFDWALNAGNVGADGDLDPAAWWVRSIELAEPGEEHHLALMDDPWTGELFGVPFDIASGFVVPISEQVDQYQLVPTPGAGPQVATAAMFAAGSVPASPQRRRIATYNEEPAEKRQIREQAAQQRAAASAQAPAPTTSPATTAQTTTTDQEGSAVVDVQDIIRRRGLGLPDDASDEDVTAAEAALSAELNLAGDSDTDTDDAPADEPDAAAQVAAAAATLTLPPGTRLVDEATYEAMQRGTAASVEQAQTSEADRRTREVQAAVDDGRILPARQEWWRQQYDVDPAGTQAALAALTGTGAPIREVGDSRTTSASTPSPGSTRQAFANLARQGRDQSVKG